MILRKIISTIVKQLHREPSFRKKIFFLHSLCFPFESFPTVKRQFNILMQSHCYTSKWVHISAHNNIFKISQDSMPYNPLVRRCHCCESQCMDPLSEISLFGNKSVQELGIRLKLRLQYFHFSFKLIFCIPTTTM